MKDDFPNLAAHVLKRAVVLLGGLLILTARAEAQQVRLTFTGTVATAVGVDASVQAGTVFETAVVFDLSTSPNLIDGVQARYTTLSVNTTVGDYVFANEAGATQNIFVSAGRLLGDPNPASYGYYLEYNAPGGAYTSYVYLLSAENSVVAPNHSLESIQSHPVSLFEHTNIFATAWGPGLIQGVVTSYAVEPVAAPEPSTWALLGLGAMVVAFRFIRRRAVSQSIP